MQVWDVDGKQALTAYKHPGSVRGASWSKDEKRILSWSDDGTVQVWDVDGKQALTAYKHPGSVWGSIVEQGRETHPVLEFRWYGAGLGR